MHTTWFDSLAQAAIMFPAFLISVSFHEFSHALTALLLGDNTAKRSGRLTLNPLAHINLIGLFCLLIFRIGWANPVPMDYRKFKYPRIYAIITALAGPFSNFILAIACFFCMAHFPATLFSYAATTTFMQILDATAQINVMLGVFNLLPLPPLDGSHIIISTLINRFPRLVLWLYRYSMLILLALFIIPQFRSMLMHLIGYTEHLLKTLIF
jgi:Zn-dependent protease